MKTKLKIKKRVWVILIILIILGFGAYKGIKIYEEYKYKQTYEYKLLEKGYEMKDAKLMEKNLSNKRLNYILSIDKNESIPLYITEKYYLDKNLEQYLQYQKENIKLTPDNVISIINTHRDNDFYEFDLDSNPALKSSLIVNKFYNLKNDYVPENLITISNNYAWGDSGSQKTTEETFNAYLEMYEAAKLDGYTLMINSSYRTFDEQKQVYDNYLNQYGETFADSIAARPGYSEHQSGFCLDIFSLTNSNRKTFKDSEAYQWLLNNSYKYGFILRYPEDKVEITGYDFESWHYRYVGKEISKYIFENNITFDEYYAYFIEK